MKLAALLLLAAASAAPALDFHPLVVEAQGEGGKYTYIEFRDEGKAVTYMPPRGWKFHGRDLKLCLVVPDCTGVEIDLGLIAMDEPVDGKGTNFLLMLEKFARASLPEAATKVELLGAEYNPLIIDGHQTVEVTFRYVIFGRPIKVSLLYLARKSELLCFRVVAPPAEFDRLHQTFRLSLHTFAGL